MREMDIRDVTDPDLIWTFDPQVLEQVRIAWKPMAALRRFAFFTPFFAVNSHVTHHACHAFMVDFDLELAPQLGRDASHAIGWELPGHLPNVGLQGRIVTCPARDNNNCCAASPRGDKAFPPESQRPSGSRASVSVQGWAQKARDFFCRIEFERQPPHDAFQFVDPCGEQFTFVVALKDQWGVSQKFGFPVRQLLRTQLMPAADLCGRKFAGEDFQDALGS